MIHAYFEYITTEYPRQPGHQMLLVQLHGERAGQRGAGAARQMLARAGKRAGLGVIKPHAFQHSFASAVLDAADGNLLIARDAGGWPRPRQWMRFTGTPTCATQPSTPRCAPCGVRRRDRDLAGSRAG